MADTTDLSYFAVMPSGPSANTRRRVNVSLMSMTEQLKRKPFELLRRHVKKILAELKFFYEFFIKRFGNFDITIELIAMIICYINWLPVSRIIAQFAVNKFKELFVVLGC